MEAQENKCSSGYGKPPWIFRGRALYQLHLVKAETARASIPKEFRLVEAFGYTLGGFFLASYDDSPVGNFDELVVISGLVWNRPTSCAWAAKVLVNNDEACDHGRKEVGLPSRVARFSKIKTATPRHQKSKSGFLNLISTSTTFYSPTDQVDVQVTEVKGPAAEDVCNINLTTFVPFNKWMGPAIKMSLPSYSGHTEFNPHLLKYSCQLECRVRAIQPAKVSVAFTATMKENEQSGDIHHCQNGAELTAGNMKDEEERLSISMCVMLSKPLLALEFSCMNMKVEAPTVVSHSFKHSLRTS